MKYFKRFSLIGSLALSLFFLISIPSASAAVSSLTASPNPVVSGSRATLTWSSSGAVSCTAGGPWSNQGTLSGSGLTNPLFTATTFTFQCYGPGAALSPKSVTVTIAPAPASINGLCAATHYSCSAGNSALPTESSSSYSWFCFGTGGGSTATCSEAKPKINGLCAATHYSCSAGNSALPTESSSSYSWFCFGLNGGGTAVCSEAKAVTPCALPWGGTIQSGYSVTAALAPSVVSPATCTYQNRVCTNGTLSGIYTNQTCSVIAPPVNGVCSSTRYSCSSGNSSPGTDTSSAYNWFCYGTGGGSTATCTETKLPPTATLSVSPASAAYGSRATIFWSSTNATSCTAGGSWSNASSPLGPNSGLTDPLTSPSNTFTFTCTGPGGSVTKSVTVTVAVPINGSCAATHYNCVPPSTAVPLSNVDGVSAYLWSCAGLYGGNIVACSETKVNTTGTLTPTSSTCTIASGSNSCTQTLSWTTTNPIGTSAVTSPTGTPSTANGNNGSRSFTVPYHPSGVNFYLYNNAVLLAQATVNTTCAAGSTWLTNSCFPNSCPLPWGGGGTIKSGQSVTAYQSSSVTSPETCLSQTRYCSNGSLSGIYTNQTCSVNPASVYSCTGLPANANPFVAPDNTGLSTNTTYTYSNTDTVAKCQFNCLNGYSWNGSSCATANTAPTANAGSDRTISLPTSSVTISGASENDSDGTISARLWTRTSGPSYPTVTSGTTLTPTFSNLIAGTYVFRLTVTDNGGATGFDEMSVVVSSAPVMTGTLTPASSSCTVASGANSCTNTLTWNTTNPVGTSAVTSPTGTPSPANGNSGSRSFTAPYNVSGVNFFLYNNGTKLAQATVTTACVAGTAWNGSRCTANPTGTLTLSPTSCVIASGASTCTVKASWNTSNTTVLDLMDGNVGGGSLSKLKNSPSGGLTVWVSYPQTVFNLVDALLDTETATATCAEGSFWNGSSCVAGTCSNGANNPPTCTTCTAPETMIDGVCTTPPPGTLSITVSPNTYTATLPNSTISATYTLANGTSANTNCRLLDNVGSPLTEYAPCTGSMTVTAPAVSGTYGYSIRANKSSTGETVTSNNFTVMVNAIGLTCSNDANNPPICDQCPSGLAYIGGSCIACSGGCSGIGGTPENPTGDLICNNGATNPHECSIFTPTPLLSSDLDTIDNGQSATLTWSSPDADAISCSFVGTPANGVSTGGATSGSVSTGPLSSTQNYQIICIDADGNTSAPALVTITVLQPSVTISANPPRVQPGANSTISWSSSQMESCSTSGPGFTTTTELSGSQAVTILSQSTYTITCQATGFPQATQSVIVNILPIFQEF